MRIEITSFGHKYGIPEANVVLDARCMENPFWVPELKEKSGLDAEVQDYILGFPECKAYLECLTELLSLQAAMAKKRGTDCLRVAVGCTGGRHRSVTAAELLAKHFREENYEITLTHRDIRRG